MKESLSLLNESELALATPQEIAEYLACLERINLASEQRQLSDLASFCREAWKVLEPATELKWNWHHDLICEYLQLARDRVIQRLIVNVPPQTGKSRLLSVFYPTWTWTTTPSRRFMAVSYSGGDDGLSTMHSMERRKIMESEWFQRTFPRSVKFVTRGKSEFENAQGGRMTATSPGGTATGKGVHDIILDDLINPKQAESDAERKKAIDFIDTTLRTRLSDQVTGVIVIVEQRTHEEDATGHVLKQEPGKWVHLKLPMIAEEDERWVFPISGRAVERKKGELLQENRFPKPVLDSLRISMGSRIYETQYQQRPSPAGGSIIKRAWLRYWNETTKPEKFDEIICSFDMSFKDAKDSSEVCGQAWGRKGARKLLLEEGCDKMDFVTSQKFVVSLYTKYPTARAFYIEDKANGPAIISSLKSVVPRMIAVPVKDSKEARMFAVSPEHEAGNVEYPNPDMEGFSWVREHIEEILRFPNKPNDRGDAESQALDQLRKSVSTFDSWLRSDKEKRDAEKLAAEAKRAVESAAHLGAR